MKVNAYAAKAPKSPLTEFEYQADKLAADEIRVKISHCGICHSDIHLIDNDWGTSQYPLVPGHEIIGIVADIGSNVKDIRIGDRVGIGWQCDSCLHCEWCLQGRENLCSQNQAVAVDHYGGFSEYVQAHERFVFKLPESLSSENAAPLLCAGITVYSPLHVCNITANMHIGVIGIGGLGHLALQFYRAFGCEVTAFSSDPKKENDAKQFGAHHFVLTNKDEFLKNHTNKYDVIVSTVPVNLPWDQYLSLLRPNGQFCILGAATEIKLNPMSIIIGNKRICGSGIGDSKTIKEMLQFAALHHITAKTELFNMAEVNKALDLVRKNAVYYRAVCCVK